MLQAQAASGEGPREPDEGFGQELLVDAGSDRRGERRIVSFDKDRIASEGSVELLRLLEFTSCPETRGAGD